MKNTVKIGLGLVVLAVIIGLGCFFLSGGFKGKKEGFLPLTSEAEAKHMLLQLRAHIVIHQIETETYEGVDFSTLNGVENSTAVAGVLSTGENDDKGYWLGNIENQDLINKAKELCPDCKITKNGFKAIGVALVDGKYVAKTITQEDSEVKDLKIP